MNANQVGAFQNATKDRYLKVYLRHLVIVLLDGKSGIHVYARLVLFQYEFQTTVADLKHTAAATTSYTMSAYSFISSGPIHYLPLVLVECRHIETCVSCVADPFIGVCTYIQCCTPKGV